MLPLTSRHRDRIVDREVMKLRLRGLKPPDPAAVRVHGTSPTRPRSVLVAIEVHDVEAASAAVAAAGVLASALGAEVILAGVVPLVPPETPGEPARSLRPTVDGLTRSRVTEAAQRLPADVVWRTVLCWGATGPAIVDAARQQAADLVVVSMRGVRPVRDLPHDGADRYVLRHSEVPVLVVPVEAPVDEAA
jgi:nucleotide-binding universal stress UspA family protein